MSPPDLSASIRQRVREAARDRCGYCLSPQQYVMGKLEVEHILPRAQGGSDEESNLWLSCSLCNRYKGSQVAGVDPSSGATVVLFNPRTQVWGEHFRWSPDGTQILSLTPIGRATVEALQLNNELYPFQLILRLLRGRQTMDDRRRAIVYGLSSIVHRKVSFSTEKGIAVEVRRNWVLAGWHPPEA